MMFYGTVLVPQTYGLLRVLMFPCCCRVEQPTLSCRSCYNKKCFSSKLLGECAASIRTSQTRNTETKTSWNTKMAPLTNHETKTNTRTKKRGKMRRWALPYSFCVYVFVVCICFWLESHLTFQSFLNSVEGGGGKPQNVRIDSISITTRGSTKKTNELIVIVYFLNRF